jgi:Ca-activated chloride channel homolog
MKDCGRIVTLLALLLTFNLPCAGQTADAKPPPRAVEPLILTTTVVNKKGGIVSGLQRDNFRVFIEKKPADITDFREEDEPLSMGIVVDVSGSAGSAQSFGTMVQNWQQALRTLLETSNQSNEYFLMAFNIKPQLLLDWTSDPQAIIDTLRLLQPKGNTAFYDACYLAIDKVRHGRYAKRVLLLISDGEDNISTYSFNQVRDELRSSDVLVYSVNFSGVENLGSTLGMEGQQLMNELSIVSGGMSFYRSSGRFLPASDARSIFQLIAHELRHQYTIAITPGASVDTGKWHKIRIKIQAAANGPSDLKHLSARTREGFYLDQR